MIPKIVTDYNKFNDIFATFNYLYNRNIGNTLFFTLQT